MWVSLRVAESNVPNGQSPLGTYSLLLKGAKLNSSMDAPTTAAPRFSLKLMMRFRRKGEDRWRDTKTLNVSSSGAVFLTKE